MSATHLSGPLVLTEVQVLTGAGAVDIITPVTRLVTTGADALTLADGEQGQMKYIVMDTDGGDGTLTPSNLLGGSTITFDAIGETATLLFDNASWTIQAVNGATIA